MSETRGTATLHIAWPNGTEVVREEGLTEKKEDHEYHVAILTFEMDDGTRGTLCFRRGELSQLLAHPDGSYRTEVALSLENPND